MKTVRLAVVCALAVLPQSAFAWGPEGHAIVADIAEAQLTPAAHAEVSRLLATEGKRRMSDVSSWADKVKRQHLPGETSHSLRLSLTGGRDNPNACPSKRCAETGIEENLQTLSDKSLPLERREMALKFVIHLVGDIHQPLHTSRNTGGGVHVIFEGHQTGLHRLWDNGLIKAHGGTADEIAAQLLRNPPRVKLGGDPMNWAEEGRDIARDVIFHAIPGGLEAAKRPKHDADDIDDEDPGAMDDQDNGKGGHGRGASEPQATGQAALMLAPDYEAKMWPIVAQRLTQAGDRLAMVLNQALH